MVTKKHPCGRVRRRLPIFPCSCPHSIIGEEELNYRVRDGNGCALFANVTSSPAHTGVLVIDIVHDPCGFVNPFCHKLFPKTIPEYPARKKPKILLQQLFGPLWGWEGPLTSSPGDQDTELLALKTTEARKPRDFRLPGSMSKKGEPPGKSTCNGVGI